MCRSMDGGRLWFRAGFGLLELRMGRFMSVIFLRKRREHSSPQGVGARSAERSL